MTKAEAEELRRQWKSQARPGELCKHALLALESTDKGYLTGSYYCSICGEQVVRKPSG